MRRKTGWRRGRMKRSSNHERYRLCGALRYEAKGERQFAGLCYCRDCRQGLRSGSYRSWEFRATRCGSPAKFSSKTVSGRDVVRNFCPTCGGLVKPAGADLSGGRWREPSQHTSDLRGPPFPFAGRGRDTAFIQRLRDASQRRCAGRLHGLDNRSEVGGVAARALGSALPAGGAGKANHLSGLIV
jgi:hypothetical protein